METLEFVRGRLSPILLPTDALGHKGGGTGQVEKDKKF